MYFRNILLVLKIRVKIIAIKNCNLDKVHNRQNFKILIVFLHAFTIALEERAYKEACFSGDEAYIDSDGNAYRKDSTVSVESGSQRMRNGSAPENNNDNDDNLSEVAAIPRFNYFLFAAPAFCDVLATSIQYVGLTLTSASSYQMLRGKLKTNRR